MVEKYKEEKLEFYISNGALSVKTTKSISIWLFFYLLMRACPISSSVSASNSAAKKAAGN
ncbi:hypothetical protein [Bacillus sp. JCM 19041]|uniref:hypothetical protein n=1 Tax=Bacillus sp. JCM 19041 TaxID=1460637 RepID=UPI0006D0ABF5